MARVLRSIHPWRDWPLLFVGLSVLGALLLCAASILSLAGTEVGWLLISVDYRTLPIFGMLFLGALVASGPLALWRALVAGEHRRALATAAWVALAGLALLLALGSYTFFFKSYRVEDSISTSATRYYLLSHHYSAKGLEIITLYACDRSGTFCHQVYETSADDSVVICSYVNGGCFLRAEGERVLVYVGGDLVYTAGP